MARRTTRPELTPEQRAVAQRIRRALLDAATEDLGELAESLASRDDSTTFGPTELLPHERGGQRRSRQVGRSVHGFGRSSSFFSSSRVCFSTSVNRGGQV